jgi:hypothetical protein
MIISRTKKENKRIETLLLDISNEMSQHSVEDHTRSYIILARTILCLSHAFRAVIVAKRKIEIKNSICARHTQSEKEAIIPFAFATTSLLRLHKCVNETK